MGFHVTNRMGESFTDADPAVRAKVLDELVRRDDPEHSDVALTHDSEWCLSVFTGGLVTWENLEAGDPRHLLGVERESVERLWDLLSLGDVSAIEAENWRPGYGP